MDEIPKEVEVIDETTEDTEIENDKTGADKEEEDKGKAKEEGTDEVDIEKLGPEKLPEEDKTDTEEDNMDPEDKERINKIVDKKIKIEITKATEMSTYLRDNPHMVKYEKVMEMYRNHPNYQKTPLKDIAAIVAFKDAEKIGAAKEREAQKKVAETVNPGTTARKPESSGIDWSKATPAEVEAHANKVMGRG